MARRRSEWLLETVRRHRLLGHTPKPRSGGAFLSLNVAGYRAPSRSAQAEQRTFPLPAEALPGCDVILDFGRVDYISSVGLRVLVVALKKARSTGDRFVIARLTPVVKEIFAIACLDRIYTIYDTSESAYSALAPIIDSSLRSAPA